MGRIRDSEIGQSLLEYVVLLALIAIPSMIAIEAFRTAVSSYAERIAVSESLPLP